MKQLDDAFIEAKLQQLGNRLLKQPYKEQWRPENPTYGYCYIVSEAIYHYAPEKIKAYCMNLGPSWGTHWYITINNEIKDFTRKQFPFELDYRQAKGKGFFKGAIQTPRGFISKRGYEMASLLELI